MLIILKNKHSLKIDGFHFKCCIGKNGLSKKKIEGDKKTPKGVFELEKLYYRDDRLIKPLTKLKCIKINKNMGWCNDKKNRVNYNKLINTKKKIKHEKLYRKDFKYNMIIPIKYNWNNRIPGKGSCIFFTLNQDISTYCGLHCIKQKRFFDYVKTNKY